LDSLKSELPEHTVLALVEELAGGRDAPEAHVLPAAHAELIEKWHTVAALDGREQGAVAWVQILVAAPAVARVVDGVCGVADAVGVAGVDAAEVRQERDEAAPALVNAVADGVRAAHLFPRENLIGLGARQGRSSSVGLRGCALAPFSSPVIAGRFQS